MKRIFAILASAALVASLSVANAQKKDFDPYWFMQIQGGAAHTIGETSFGDLISPSAAVSFGYQFSPVFGMRLQANGWQSKGGWAGFRAQKGETPYNAQYKYKYVAPGVDFMFNLSNLFCGWNPNRVLNVTAFAGAGANIAWDNDEVNELATTIKNTSTYNLEYLWDGTKVRPYGRAGIELAFKVSKSVSLMIEGNANVISDKYNSKKADNPDWYFNALAGLRINLGKSATKKEKPVEPEPTPAPVQKVEEPAPAPAPVVEKKVEEIRRDIFFTINSNKISEKENKKILEVIDFLVKYPEAKVVVTGYADKGTGNDRVNDRIAAKRAAAVVWMLEKRYGIPAERITEESKGARVQPFAENDMNRVSIMIAK